ncbi:MAG: iron complex outermembrane receptor protein, partial [Pseudohongiellaceae bacterium]
MALLKTKSRLFLKGKSCMFIYHSKTKKTLALAISTLTALTISGAGYAQDEIEEITITGSRIQREAGFESAVPVTVLNSDELNMFEPGLGMSEQLENLPQYFGNISSDNVGGRVTADVGQSQLNMRGMGGERTLVLLDGSRVVPSDRRSSVSVDYLPSSLIQRVDVVTGGASAAYGADALAGVTNFILDRQFTGLEVAARTGINEEGDGEYTRGSVTFGTDIGAEGNLHVFGTVEARINDAYRRENADWDKDYNYVRNPDWSPTAPPGTPVRLTRPYVYDSEFSPTGLIRQNGFSLNRYQFTEDGNGVTPWIDGEYLSTGGANNQNSQAGKPGDYQYELWRRGHPQSFERVGVEQQTVFLGADFQLNDTTKLWGHALYGRTRNTPEPTSSGAAGTGLGHGTLAFMTVYPENPFLPDDVRQAMLDEGRSSIRVDQHGMLDVPWGIMERPNIVNRMWSVTGGFDTELGGDWTLRGSYQYGEAQKHNANYGWERLDRFYLAMDAVDDPSNPGTPMCRITLLQQQFAAQGRNLEQELGQWAQDNTSVFRTDAGVIDPAKPQTIDFPIAVDSVDGTISDCAPVNMFGKGQQSQAALDYVHSSRAKTGISVQKQHFAELLAQGTLHDGWGAGPIEGAIGATYRKESIDQRIVDTAIDALGPMYNVTLPDGTQAVRGISFIMNGSSTNLHRFSSQPTFSGGYDVYEVFGETIMPLFESADGAQRAEINLAARYADYSRAGGIFVWKGGLNLKLTEDLRLRATKSLDIREGSFEELFVQQGRGTNICDPWNMDICNTSFNLTGGNPNLEAEEADTTVVGFVYQPSFIDGLQFSLDRYTVDLSSAIGTLSEQNIVDQCFDSGALCELVDRDPATGFVTLVRTLFINIDAAKVSGYDMEASYRMEPDFFSDRFESLNFRLFGGYMDENSSTPLNGTKID